MNDHYSYFDEREYLELNPDVAMSVMAGYFSSGWEHYQRFGKIEGRLFSKSFSREKAIFHLIDKNGVGLEIGPSHSPLAPKRKGYKVHIVDYLSADELREKYQEQPGINIDNIEEVDYVWKGGPLDELIGKTDYYDYIIASHVIEHIPNPISFLQSCLRLLKPTGVLSLAIPDKRFCFDHFLPVTTTGMWLDAYFQNRKEPTPGQTFDYFANKSKRFGAIAWFYDKRGGADSLIYSMETAKQKWEEACSAIGEYTDVHCWRFTPTSFRLILNDLNYLGLLNFEILAEFNTFAFEFYLSLGRQKNPYSQAKNNDRLSLLQTALSESTIK